VDEEMISPVYQIINADALEVLRACSDESVHCAITSPPYWGLRDYEAVGQLGSESTVEEWVVSLVDVFRELRRVLRDDGTFFLNCGNSYGKKQLIGQAWRMAFALQDDGWFLRSDIIWHKTGPMPESATDRPTRSHEYIFLFSKGPRYFWDSEAVREFNGPVVKDGTNGRNCRSVWTFNHEPMGPLKYPLSNGSWKVVSHHAAFPSVLPERCIRAGTSEKGCCAKCGAPVIRKVKRKRIATRPGRNVKISDEAAVSVGVYKDNARHCTVTETVGWKPACDCGVAFVPCNVLDCFSGTGTTGVAAMRLGRNYLGIELNVDYAKASAYRIANPETFDDPVPKDHKRWNYLVQPQSVFEKGDSIRSEDES
jgi:DNA modification methylase